MVTSKAAAEAEQDAGKAREAARLCRIEIYSAWLTDDVDGLTHNLVSAEGTPLRGGAAILAMAREAVALALSHLEIRRARLDPGRCGSVRHASSFSTSYAAIRHQAFRPRALLYRLSRYLTAWDRMGRPSRWLCPTPKRSAGGLMSRGLQNRRGKELETRDRHLHMVYVIWLKGYMEVLWAS
jgi:hypothetical protein